MTQWTGKAAQRDRIATPAQGRVTPLVLAFCRHGVRWAFIFAAVAVPSKSVSNPLRHQLSHSA